MTNLFRGLVATVAAVALLAAFPVVASAKGGTVPPCGGLTLAVTPSLIHQGPETMPGWFTASGRTTKGCDDSDHYLIRVNDVTAPIPGVVCASFIDEIHSWSKATAGRATTWSSRYRTDFYPTQGCTGRPRTIVATLIDLRSGTVLSTATATFTP